MLGGRYKPLHEIGKGSFGTVFIGEDTKRKRKVAIKYESIGVYPSILNFECSAL